MRTAASLDAMGRAYLAENGEGYLADAYFEAIQKLAARHNADADALLGFVNANWATCCWRAMCRWRHAGTVGRGCRQVTRTAVAAIQPSAARSDSEQAAGES
jgi:hypothetical protein